MITSHIFHLMTDFYCFEENSVIVNVRIQPGSSKNSLEGIISNCLKIKIKSPPVDGKANKELIKFLSKYFKVSKMNVKIINGEKSKLKKIKLSNVNSDRWSDFLSEIKEVS